VAVQPTVEGRQAARQILDSRGGPLATLVDRLDDEDRTKLTELLSTLLRHIYDQVPDADRLCRLCDRDACLSEERICPVGQAGRDAAQADG
jgi:MarR family transcriptional repressor of emrRAB